MRFPALVLVLPLLGQSSGDPAFPSVSIKPNTNTVRRRILVRVEPGGRLITVDSPLVLLIKNAYGVEDFQVIGGPSWINTDGYDVEAKPEMQADQKQVWLMLRSLLAQRFKLQVHRETRELPGYALTVAKNGLKLPQPEDGVCATGGSKGLLPECGAVVVRPGPRLEGGKVRMSELTRALSRLLVRPVVDGTGFAGEFDVHVDFTPDESTIGLIGAGGPRDPGGFAARPTDPNRPPILLALQDQLGLKLNAAKAAVEVLVIDHVERPDAN
jgi:uncharacterized protein (TIGR03435 family)